MIKRFVYTLCLVCVFQAILWGQSFHLTEHPLYYRYDQVVHLDMIQDKNGMIWTATSEGIYYYDGLTFHDIELQDQIDDHRFTAIYEDRDGVIWAGSEDGSIYMIRHYGLGFKPDWEEGFPKAAIKGFPGIRR